MLTYILRLEHLIAEVCGEEGWKVLLAINLYALVKRHLSEERFVSKR